MQRLRRDTPAFSLSVTAGMEGGVVRRMLRQPDTHGEVEEFHKRQVKKKERKQTNLTVGCSVYLMRMNSWFAACLMTADLRSHSVIYF